MSLDRVTPPHRRGVRARTRNATLAAVLGLLVGFVALGIWQLERRLWKLALIERVEQRVHAVSVDAPGPERWSSIDRDDDEYLHVRARGTFLDDRATRVRAVTDYGAGYWLMVPLVRDGGDVVLVNRGFVTGAGSATAAGSRSAVPMSSTPPVVVTGLLRISEPRGGFLRDNDPAHDRWTSRDVEAIARARGLQHVAPYFIDAEADPGAAALGIAPSPTKPIAGLTVIAFRNDHLL